MLHNKASPIRGFRLYAGAQRARISDAARKRPCVGLEGRLDRERVEELKIEHGEMAAAPVVSGGAFIMRPMILR
jgi:hypothetical protein